MTTPVIAVHGVQRSATARCLQSATTKVESHAYNVHEELVNYREVGELGVHEHLLFLVLCDARGAAGQGAEQVQPNLFGEANTHIHVRRTVSKPFADTVVCV